MRCFSGRLFPHPQLWHIISTQWLHRLPPGVSLIHLTPPLCCCSHSLSKHPSREWEDAGETDREWHYGGIGYLTRVHSCASLQVGSEISMKWIQLIGVRLSAPPVCLARCHFFSQSSTFNILSAHSVSNKTVLGSISILCKCIVHLCKCFRYHDDIAPSHQKLRRTSMRWLLEANARSYVR